MTPAGGGPSAADEPLLARLRQLALVELDALTRGLTPDGRLDLVRLHGEELAGALGEARERAQALITEIGRGPDLRPALEIEGGRGGAAGRAAAERARAGLVDRAEAARALARLDEATARLLPRLTEVRRCLGG